MFHIRQEIPTDHPQVYDLVKTAFAGAEYADGTEQDLVVRLRGSDAFLPQLSLVAETGTGRIAGHILFTKIELGNLPALCLAPLAVHLEFQGQGVGQLLMAQGHHIARGLGYAYVVLLGHTAYYSRAGYRPAHGFGIRSPFPVPEENFMALDLTGHALLADHEVVYPKEFML